MLVAIDTSVWIDYFRGSDHSLVEEVNALLDENQVCITVPVWIEILSGASKKEQPRLKPLLSALPRFYPSGKITWKTMENWVALASKKGRRFAAADLLIAAIASENEAKVWSLDSDFEELEKLKFIKLYR